VTFWNFQTGENILVLLRIEPVSLGCPGKMVKTRGMNSAVFYFNTSTVDLLLFVVINKKCTIIYIYLYLFISIYIYIYLYLYLFIFISIYIYIYLYLFIFISIYI
jgi:hypothetical protein